MDKMGGRNSSEEFWLCQRRYVRLNSCHAARDAIQTVKDLSSGHVTEKEAFSGSFVSVSSYVQHLSLQPWSKSIIWSQVLLFPQLTSNTQNPSEVLPLLSTCGLGVWVTPKPCSSKVSMRVMFSNLCSQTLLIFLPLVHLLTYCPKKKHMIPGQVRSAQFFSYIG
jgi:hypothetical protein